MVVLNAPEPSDQHASRAPRPSPPPPRSQEELASELERELASYGIDPGAIALPDPHYRRSLAELRRRRAAAGAGMDGEDRRRMKYMRATVTWHVNKVGRRGEEGAAA